MFRTMETAGQECGPEQNVAGSVQGLQGSLGWLKSAMVADLSGVLLALPEGVSHPAGGYFGDRTSAVVVLEYAVAVPLIPVVVTAAEAAAVVPGVLRVRTQRREAGQGGLGIVG
jgi:hypothetical protein